jgi:hypothetical protein
MRFWASFLPLQIFFLLQGKPPISRTVFWQYSPIFVKWIPAQIIGVFKGNRPYESCQYQRMMKKSGLVSIGETDATFPSNPTISGL